jgi:hypothetical protein
MLPIYKAIAFNKIIKLGGRTQPWSVLVETQNGIQSYVVKMFRGDEVDPRDPVTKEVLGNLLAKQFDLRVPEAALIEMDENFRTTIKDTEAQSVYQLADKRMKFGSALIEGNYLFSPTFTKTQAAKMIELDTLFAYDVFIRNRDRTAFKPNLLVKGNSAFLIDHELGFEIDDQTTIDLLRGKLNYTSYQHHICWKYLKKSRNPIKKEYFNSFIEYLKTLDLHSLEPYFQQLSDLGFNTANHENIKNYLSQAKKNLVTFANLLKLSIS